MNDLFCNDTLQKTLGAQVFRNTNMLYLSDRAAQLPFCKRNIMRVKLLLWDCVFNEFVERFIFKISQPIRNLNMNERCKQILLENNLSHSGFAEFFFAFHEPLTEAFLRLIENKTAAECSIDKKLNIVAQELTELLNIAWVELDGMRIDCELFGSAPICPMYKEHGKKECTKATNILTVMMTEDYYLEKDLFCKIIDASTHLQQGKEILIVVNYGNFCRSIKEKYNWIENGGFTRYEKCMKLVKQVYFYQWEECVDFGGHTESLKSFMIPNKQGLYDLRDSWKNKKELIRF